MKSQDHKSTTDDGKAKTRPGIKASPQVNHPILQLQQLVGNKAVTNMIQRDESSDGVSQYAASHGQEHDRLYQHLGKIRDFISTGDSTLASALNKHKHPHKHPRQTKALWGARELSDSNE